MLWVSVLILAGTADTHVVSGAFGVTLGEHQSTLSSDFEPTRTNRWFRYRQSDFFHQCL